MQTSPRLWTQSAAETRERPFISFIVPVLNAEKDIGHCLQAIQNLEYDARDYEVLIMDNGSTDGTHRIIRNLGLDFHVIPQVHVSALRNRGAARAHGDYLAFVDADVELAPCWLQSALRAFQDQEVVASGCFPRVPHAATWVQKTWDIHQRGRQDDTKLTAVSWLASMNLIVRREDLLAIGGFNEQLETVEDVDLCYRLGQRGVILNNPAMEAIHWGEAPDLRTFWRKEVWRGIGNMQGVSSHGLRWDEVPSLGYPLYMLCCVLLCIIGVCVDVWRLALVFTPWGGTLLVFPALLLAINTARRAKRLAAIPPLFLLYIVYGLARAFAVVKAGTTSRT